MISTSAASAFAQKNGVAYEPSHQPMYATYATQPMSTYEVIAHRVFVGGFPSNTLEVELRSFFEQFGHIREAKIIRGTDGASKGYGFITFDSEEEANSVRTTNPENLEFKGRRLNLGPAMRRVTQTARFAEPAFFTANGQILAANNLHAVSPGFIPHNYVVVPQTQVPWGYNPSHVQGSPSALTGPTPAEAADSMNNNITVKREKGPHTPSTPAPFCQIQQVATGDMQQQQYYQVHHVPQGITPMTPPMISVRPTVYASGTAAFYPNGVQGEYMHYN